MTFKLNFNKIIVYLKVYCRQAQRLPLLSYSKYSSPVDLKGFGSLSCLGVLLIFKHSVINIKPETSPVFVKIIFP